MEENDVKSTCGVDIGKFFIIWRVVKKFLEMWQDEKNLIRNLTRRKKFDSKSDTTKNF